MQGGFGCCPGSTYAWVSTMSVAQLAAMFDASEDVPSCHTRLASVAPRLPGLQPPCDVPRVVLEDFETGG
jgi:hypothetical protein